MQIGPSGTIAAGPSFDTPTFRWTSVSGAVSYYLYVLDATTNQAVVNNPSLSGTSSMPATPLTPGHSFTWYIGAAAASGAISWSWETFALAALTAPTLIGPGGTVSAGSVSTTPTFSWNSSTGANHYYLYLLDATTNQVLINNANVFGTTYTNTPVLTVNHRYIWYVAAESADGAAFWSGPDSFTLVP